MMKKRITVIGSINSDILLTTKHFPKIGETVFCQEKSMLPGGKGANQAVAASRLNEGNVILIGAVGNDLSGKSIQTQLIQENVNTDELIIFDHLPTGTAYIIRSERDNSIIVDSGANAHLTAKHIYEKEAIIKQSDIILAQLEIPLECIYAIAEIAQANQIPFILNPAPAKILDDDLLQKITLITPNEHEIIKIKKNTELQSIETIFEQYQDKIIMTYGKKGVLYYTQNKIHNKKAHSVSVVDTTGAGDTFNGALAAFFHLGLDQALDLSIIAAALSITKIGAQTGIPQQTELFDYCKSIHIPIPSLG